jgi:hypothetical protein
MVDKLYYHEYYRRDSKAYIERVNSWKKRTGYDEKYRNKNRDKLRLYQRDYQREFRKTLTWKERFNENIAKLKSDCLSHYSGGTPKCKCCGESHIEFLTIDHINGRNKTEKRLTGYTLYRDLIKKNHPEGFQVMDNNCNQAKGHGLECEHKLCKIVQTMVKTD